jgi:hypothetical protein
MPELRCRCGGRTSFKTRHLKELAPAFQFSYDKEVLA